MTKDIPYAEMGAGYDGQVGVIPVQLLILAEKNSFTLISALFVPVCNTVIYASRSFLVNPDK